MPNTPPKVVMSQKGDVSIKLKSDVDGAFMQEALDQARLALDEGEVPVGCVIVRDEIIVGRGRNATNKTRNGTRHAEMMAIDEILEASFGSVAAARFHECQLYVTCEPCIMCAGALSLLGFKSVTYGCANDKFGGNGSILSVHTVGCGSCGGGLGTKWNEGDGPGGAFYQSSSSTYSSVGGLYAEEAIKLLQDFYIAGNPNAPKPHRALGGRR